jgi:hypothetical protein
MNEIAFDIETIPDPNISPELEEALFKTIILPKELCEEISVPRSWTKKSEAQREQYLADAKVNRENKIAEYILNKKLEIRGDFALSPTTGRVASVAFYAECERGIEMAYTLEEELETLRAFWHAVQDIHEEFRGAVRWISYNGKSFDLPFLIARSAKYKIKPKVLIDTKRFDLTRHFDLIDALSNFGAARKTKLDYWLMAFGLPRKTESGANVGDMWDAGRYEDIGNYCLEDCKRTLWLYQPIKPFFGFS